MIDHVTYQLSKEAIGYSALEELMGLIGFEEIEPNDPFEHGYDVRWFESLLESAPGEYGPKIHFVADGASCDVSLGLGHFCVLVGPDRYEVCRESDYLARDSGSGRIWLEYDNNRLRIEVRKRS